MTTKIETLYRAKLLSIRELIPNSNPAFALGDFELASRKALETIFASNITTGCWFHFTKAIYEKIQKIGLSKLYKTNQAFKKGFEKKAFPIPSRRRDSFCLSFTRTTFTWITRL